MNKNPKNMVKISYPNVRPVAILLVLAILVTGAALAVVQSMQPSASQAAAEYIYKSEPQWYNGPVAKPALGGSRLAFVTLWEGGGQYLYVTDLVKHKDAKITLENPVTNITEPVVSDSFVAWNDTAKNKWQIKMFELYSYTTLVVRDTMNEVGAPSLSNNVVVWREANEDQASARIMWYNHTTTETRTLAAGKWYSDPVIAGNRVAWFETSATCAGDAYRLCVPQNAAWDLVIWETNNNQKTIIKTNIVSKYKPTIATTQVVWAAEVNGQYDLYRYIFSSGRVEKLTDTELEEGYPVLSAGRVAYLGIPKNGAVGVTVVHLLDIDSKNDVAMPHKNVNHAHLTVSGNRVAWTEVRTDSRIYIYDLDLSASETDVDSDSLSVAKETALGTSDLAKDTDGDKVPDTDEVVLFHTNPTAQDSDGDGLTDYQELFLYHSNPTKFDTDGDSYHDGLEVKSGYSPTDPRPIKVGKNYFTPTVK